MIELLRKIIKDKKILLLGYGREGRSSWLRIKEAGGFSEIAVADMNEVKLESDNPAKLIFGPNYQKCLDDYDVVFKSPGIVLEKPIEEYKCEILSQTEVFFRRYSSQCIGITGTKGKSTTTTLIYHILKESGFDTVLVGNIGIPMFDLVDEITENTKIVCELSCHQLEYAKHAPHVGILLNIHEEHLDHYGTMEKYVAAKENIYRVQTAEDIIFVNVDNLPYDDTYQGKVVKMPNENSDEGADVKLENNIVMYGDKRFVIPEKDIRLIGHHNHVDIAFAYAVCQLYDITDEMFLQGLKTYEPLPHRLQYIGDFNGVRYYDDSISTICDTTIQALKSLPDTDAVIIGGMDRGIDYEDLISFLAVHPVPYIILMEATGKRILKEIGEADIHFRAPERIHLVEHLDEAVALAKELCHPGSCCVMSPAAASYGIFKNFEDRGDHFKKYVLGE